MASSRRLRISLSMKDLSDADIASTIAGIQKVAPASALFQDTSVSTSFGELGKKGASLALSVAAVAADEHQLRLDQTARDAARTTVLAELDTLRALVVNKAASASDIASMGFVASTRSSSTRTVPPAPSEIVTKLGSVHGRARVTAVGASGAGRNFVAESTLDPMSPTSAWAPLPGNGRQRTLTGATGSKVWVRFAQVRYGLQSEWSTAVLVTLP